MNTEGQRQSKNKNTERYGGYGSENADSGAEQKWWKREENESEVLGELAEERVRVKVA